MVRDPLVTRQLTTDRVKAILATAEAFGRPRTIAKLCNVILYSPDRKARRRAWRTLQATERARREREETR